jgi:hypothetical protein
VKEHEVEGGKLRLKSIAIEFGVNIDDENFDRHER